MPDNCAGKAGKCPQCQKKMQVPPKSASIPPTLEEKEAIRERAQKKRQARLRKKISGNLDKINQECREAEEAMRGPIYKMALPILLWLFSAAFACLAWQGFRWTSAEWIIHSAWTNLFKIAIILFCLFLCAGFVGIGIICRKTGSLDDLSGKTVPAANVRKKQAKACLYVLGFLSPGACFLVILTVIGIVSGTEFSSENTRLIPLFQLVNTWHPDLKALSSLPESQSKEPLVSYQFGKVIFLNREDSSFNLGLHSKIPVERRAVELSELKTIIVWKIRREVKDGISFSVYGGSGDVVKGSQKSIKISVPYAFEICIIDYKRKMIVAKQFVSIRGFVRNFDTKNRKNRRGLNLPGTSDLEYKVVEYVLENSSSPINNTTRQHKVKGGMQRLQSHQFNDLWPRNARN